MVQHERARANPVGLGERVSHKSYLTLAWDVLDVRTVAIADCRGVWPNGPVVELPGVRHFCQEDAPEILVSNIVQFLQSTHT